MKFEISVDNVNWSSAFFCNMV